MPKYLKLKKNENLSPKKPELSVFLLNKPDSRL